MRNRFLRLFSLSLVVLASSCSKEEVLPEIVISESQLEVVSYFKDVALGFENGNSSDVTRKWDSPMRIYIDGDTSSFLENEVEQVVNEINALVTDGFFIEIVESRALSNSHIFFGTPSEFFNEFPDSNGPIGSNFALFNVWRNGNILNRARIFIDTERPNLTEQESLIREEITQTLGLGKDSPRFPNSIFYETPTNGGFATEYAGIDKELIRLLYHPDMRVGLNENKVDRVLREILANE